MSAFVTAQTCQTFFDEHGLFYQEDAAIGNIIEALDKGGLSNDKEAFKFYKGFIEGSAVSMIYPNFIIKCLMIAAP